MQSLIVICVVFFMWHYFNLLQVHNLSKEQLAKREVVHVDIVNDHVSGGVHLSLSLSLDMFLPLFLSSLSSYHSLSSFSSFSPTFSLPVL